MSGLGTAGESAVDLRERRSEGGVSSVRLWRESVGPPLECCLPWARRAYVPAARFCIRSAIAHAGCRCPQRLMPAGRAPAGLGSRAGLLSEVVPSEKKSDARTQGSSPQCLWREWCARRALSPQCMRDGYEEPNRCAEHILFPPILHTLVTLVHSRGPCQREALYAVGVRAPGVGLWYGMPAADGPLCPRDDGRRSAVGRRALGALLAPGGRGVKAGPTSRRSCAVRVRVRAVLTIGRPCRLGRRPCRGLYRRPCRPFRPCHDPCRGCSVRRALVRCRRPCRGRGRRCAPACGP